MLIDKTEQASLLASSLSQLTPRERAVMHHITQGRLNKIIADELGISTRTVEAHRAKVFKKLNVRNAVELTRLLSENTPEQLLPFTPKSSR